MHLSVEHTHYPCVRILDRFLACRPRACFMNSTVARRSGPRRPLQVLPKRRLGQRAHHLGEAFKVALTGFEDFNIMLVALVQNPEITIPENDDDTVELTRASFEHELAGLSTRPTLQGCGSGLPAWLASANQLLHALVPQPSRFFSDGRILFSKPLLVDNMFTGLFSLTIRTVLGSQVVRKKLSIRLHF